MGALMFFFGGEELSTTAVTNPATPLLTYFTKMATSLWFYATLFPHQSNGYGGNYSFSCRDNGGGGLGVTTPNLGSTHNWCGWYMDARTALITAECWVSAVDATNVQAASVLWSDTTGNPVEIRRGGYTGTLLATSASLPRGAAHYFWAMFDCKNVAGTIAVYIDGQATPFVTFTGDTTNLASDGHTGFGISSSNDTGFHWDDWVALTDAEKAAIPALNAALGLSNPPRVELYVVQGLPASNDAGTFTNGIDYQNVDDRVPTGATYDEGTAAAQQNTYGWAGLPFVPTAVAGVSVGNTGSRDGTITTFTPVLKSGATTSLGTAKAFGATGSLNFTQSFWATDPNTAAQWVLANVNAIKFGARIG